MTGVTKDVQPAKDYFNTVLQAKHRPIQEGAAAINIATGGSKALPAAEKGPIDVLLEGVTGVIGNGFDRILDALKSVGGGGR